MSSTGWEYCSLIWWHDEISHECGAEVVHYTPEGAQREVLLRLKPKVSAIKGVSQEDLDKCRKAVSSTMAKLGLEGWEAVHGEPSGIHWVRLQGGVFSSNVLFNPCRRSTASLEQAR